MEELLLAHVYDHYKGGKYLVVSIAEDSTNARVGAKVVMYVSLTYGKVKCRDLTEFTQMVTWPDGEKRPRFIASQD
jgi:hypothetical protein